MGHVKTGHSMSVALALVMVAASAWTANAQSRTVDLSGSLVPESFKASLKNDPNRCVVHLFLEFPSVRGITLVAALLTKNGQDVPLYGSPPFDDHYVGLLGDIAYGFDVGEGRHRIHVASVSHGQGCDKASAELGDWTVVGVTAQVEGAFFRLSGTVRGCPPDQPRCADPSPLEGVTVGASGPDQATTLTGSNGTYAMDLAEGSYEVAPAGGLFDPASRSVDLSSDQAGVDFVARRTHRITGTVTACPGDAPCPAPAPAEGVQVRAAGPGGAEAITDSDGRYALDVPPGTWRVAPITGEAGSVPESRTIDVRRDVGAVDFRTCSVSPGAFVPCSSLVVTLQAVPAPVFVEQAAEGPVPTTVSIGVTIRNRGTRPMHNVTLDPVLVMGYITPTLVDRLPMRLVDDPTPIPLGTLAPRDERSQTLTYSAVGDGHLELTGLVTYSVEPGSVTLHSTGTSTLELDTRLLVASMRLDDGKWVRSPDAPKLIKAGTAYAVTVKLENRSFTRRLIVWDVVGARGNADGGHWQPEGLPIQVTEYSKLGIEACTAPPAISLDPLQSAEWDVVFRALASDPSRSFEATSRARAAGGTRAVLELFKPHAWVDRGDGTDPVRVEDPRIVVLRDAKTVQVSIDDRAKAVPEYRGPGSWAAAFAYYSLGLFDATIAWTWSMVHGLLVDLPVLAVQGALELPTLVKKYTLLQVELWDQVKNDPLLAAAYFNTLGNMTLVSLRLLPDVVKGGEKVLDQVNAAAREHFDHMWNEWYAGDWVEASYAFGHDTGTLALEVAMLVAPCVLTRLPRVTESLKAAKAAELAASAEALAARAGDATDAARAMEVLGEAASKARLPGAAAQAIKLGTPLSDALLKQLFGLTQEQIDWARAWAKRWAADGKPFLYTIRSRAAETLKWVGAYLKPEQFKIKTVDWIDVEYLRYSYDDLGRLVVKPPIDRVAVERQLLNEGWAESTKRWDDVMKRLDLREFEYYTDEAQYVRSMRAWSEAGEVDFKFNWLDNLVDPLAAPVEEPVIAAFKLQERRRFDPVLRMLVTEWEVLVDPTRTGKWRSVLGDVDGVALTDVFSFNLSDPRHIELAGELRNPPFSISHLESASWTPRSGGFNSEQKLQYLRGVHAQLGPDGVFRLVEFDETLSALRSVDNYHIWFKGGYVVP